MYLLAELKYQILRSKRKSLLMICIAAVMFSCMILYLSNIESTEAALNTLSQSIPVRIWVTSRNGAKRTGLSIDENHFQALIDSKIDNPLYTSKAVGVIEQSKDVQEPFLGGDTRITGANDINAINGLSEDMFYFKDGYDISFISTDKPVCAIHEEYANKHGIEIDDKLVFPIYGVRYTSTAVSYELIGAVEISVIGIYKGVYGNIQLLPDMCVPIKWLKEISEDKSIMFSYESFTALLSDPLNLNSFKDRLPQLGYLEVFKEAQNSTTGDAVCIDDELFIKTAEELKQNISSFKFFQWPFFVLIIVLMMLVIFLLLRSHRHNIALAKCLGQYTFKIGLTYFFCVMILNLFGCLMVLPGLVYLTKVTTEQILGSLMIFLLCACISTIGALLCLLNFDTQKLLTQID